MEKNEVYIEESDENSDNNDIDQILDDLDGIEDQYSENLDNKQQKAKEDEEDELNSSESQSFIKKENEYEKEEEKQMEESKNYKKYQQMENDEKSQQKVNNQLENMSELNSQIGEDEMAAANFYIDEAYYGEKQLIEAEKQMKQKRNRKKSRSENDNDNKNKEKSKKKKDKKDQKNQQKNKKKQKGKVEYNPDQFKPKYPYGSIIASLAKLGKGKQAVCKKCKKEIHLGNIRIGVQVTHFNMINWRHLKCFPIAQRYANYDIQKIYDLEGLNDDDQLKIIRHFQGHTNAAKEQIRLEQEKQRKKQEKLDLIQARQKIKNSQQKLDGHFTYKRIKVDVDVSNIFNENQNENEEQLIFKRMTRNRGKMQEGFYREKEMNDDIFEDDEEETQDEKQKSSGNKKLKQKNVKPQYTRQNLKYDDINQNKNKDTSSEKLSNSISEFNIDEIYESNDSLNQDNGDDNDSLKQEQSN
ncbi:hypothetical protein PPERSA_06526 [Pseudocohnilembus persalinus]|uniref:PARP-type domain-containing protein n=1 Tax=Pseudocohnilembus persalinus TaxID=266149 RepID=A0A0V0QRR2_PSEPJ|nr:hypothetical protein PPERSA_06526 [Pseudocohnilembus persalinus]|eukprot:KRX04892.1 hypothetical protein PPERSA_06526 [Pseudocohnilembus persalinus]